MSDIINFRDKANLRDKADFSLECRKTEELNSFFESVHATVDMIRMFLPIFESVAKSAIEDAGLTWNTFEVSEDCLEYFLDMASWEDAFFDSMETEVCVTPTLTFEHADKKKTVYTIDVTLYMDMSDATEGSDMPVDCDVELIKEMRNGTSFEYDFEAHAWVEEKDD